ncbi:MAG: DUF2235 domain-containing protein [Proteobacteria bacterium]|nr:DUF2235 domain-containing protein [Pseudomonadota bacterium]
MAKRIVLCLDGTWNEEGQTDHGVEVETNVLKLYKALVNSPAQVDRYFAGVGTRPFEKISGGAFGWGLFNQIKDAYRALIRVYDAGDQIFIFGFSRGAYSARSLAGMVLRCGVLRKDVDHRRLAIEPRLADVLTTTQDPNLLPDATDKVFALYKHGYDVRNRDDIALFKARNCHDADIHFIGVWDTVGALGLPDKLVIPALRGIDSKLREEWFGFLDTELSPRVNAACHALAIDERREPFLPTLWTDARGLPPRINQAGSGVKQVWFAGAHSNVGGGYADTGLSDIALTWMARAAAQQGLSVDGALFQRAAPDATALRRDSLGEFLAPGGGQKHKLLALGALVERFGGAIHDIARSQIEVDRPIARGSAIHHSVNARLEADSVVEPGRRGSYQPPPTLKLDPAGARQVDLERYTIEAP